MTLFVLASKDGWVSIMYQGLDAVGIDQQVSTPQSTKNTGSLTITTKVSFTHLRLIWAAVVDKFIPRQISNCFIKQNNQATK